MIPAARQHEAYVRAGVMLLLMGLLAAGFWLRVRHLEDLGLVVDEGNQALAVRGILQYGVPKVDSGLIYARAVSFLYAQAASAALFGLNEFSLRFPSVLFGVGLPDENAHAPDEKLDLGNFHNGIIASAYLYKEIASLNGND